MAQAIGSGLVCYPPLRSTQEARARDEPAHATRCEPRLRIGIARDDLRPKRWLGVRPSTFHPPPALRWVTNEPPSIKTEPSACSTVKISCRVSTAHTMPCPASQA